MRVAMRRAAHQLFDTPRVLDDPVALAVIGQDAASQLKAEPAKHRGRISRSVRAFMAVRSRLAEDELARAVRRGVVQYVILGAGLDTFAHRSPYPESALQIFEVDYPATQAWKRRKLADILRLAWRHDVSDGRRDCLDTRRHRVHRARRRGGIRLCRSPRIARVD